MDKPMRKNSIVDDIRAAAERIDKANVPTPRYIDGDDIDREIDNDDLREAKRLERYAERLANQNKNSLIGHKTTVTKAVKTNMAGHLTGEKKVVRGCQFNREAGDVVTTQDGRKKYKVQPDGSLRRIKK